MIAVVGEIVAGAVALFIAALIAARAGVLVIHFRKPPKPRKRPVPENTP